MVYDWMPVLYPIQKDLLTAFLKCGAVVDRDVVGVVYGDVPLRLEVAHRLVHRLARCPDNARDVVLREPEADAPPVILHIRAVGLGQVEELLRDTAINVLRRQGAY